MLDKFIPVCYHIITERGKPARRKEGKKMTYKVREIAGGKFGVYEVSALGNEILRKTCKTRKAAETWISKH